MKNKVVVIGGGITGIGIARDLAMRGLEVKVLERDKIGCETSTHFHGMLHSGARYAVKDPYAAEKCIQENRILRDIADRYIEFTEGLFLKLQEDSEDYYRQKIEACRECGIPVEELSEKTGIGDAISENVQKAFKVPDGVINPIGLLKANVESARENGAEIIENAEVTTFRKSGGEVEAVKYRKDGSEEVLEADFFVNATGPWAEKTAQLAEAEADMSPTRGVMTEVKDLELDYVLNRCRPTDDGDIIVPVGKDGIIGTTSKEVEDPDSFERPEREEELMLEQGSQMVETVTEGRLIGSYWGLRPLYNPSGDGGRDATREFQLIDHKDKDGVEKLVTVVGGKWTTYRYMAEVTSDKVCEEVGIEAECRTDSQKLPDVEVKDREWPPVT